MNYLWHHLLIADTLKLWFSFMYINSYLYKMRVSQFLKVIVYR